MSQGRQTRDARTVLVPALTIAGLLVVWQLACSLGLVPAFLLPSPAAVVSALAKDALLIVQHSATTLVEAALGLAIGVATGFVFALLMDRFEVVYLALEPLMTISQTIPTIAIAPLLVLWFGYGLAPKVILIVLTTFFPVTVSLVSGFRSVDPDVLDLLRTMRASRSNSSMSQLTNALSKPMTPCALSLTIALAPWQRSLRRALASPVASMLYYCRRWRPDAVNGRTACEKAGGSVYCLAKI